MNPDLSDRREQCRGALRHAAVGQMVVGMFSLLLLDGGVGARVSGTAILGYWIGAGVVLCRRHRILTQSDLLILKRGFWPILLSCALFQKFAG
ncbi:MAG: hypothetical protein U1D30_15730 [Planctomycetota bacterium]